MGSNLIIHEVNILILVVLCVVLGCGGGYCEFIEWMCVARHR